ncbi:MAG: polysaccharide deacetylase family protein [Verrucomicrobiales bacterium]|jgi:peptidoglycan/xylan/chitin deacetylase (PgdA/CDA1 family)|nr:polysaccharide deacetylase family protein [Verrucomicrobiales bacterium]
MCRHQVFLLALMLACAAGLISCGTTVVPEKTVQPTGSVPPRAAFSHTRVRTNEPLLALTFDDGPSSAHTPRLLEILRDQDARATFFMIGRNVAAQPELVRQVAAAGHEIGSHSWSHPRLSALSVAAVTDELQKTERALLAAGVKPKYLRPPYGAFTDAQRRWVHQRFGYEFIFWDVDPNDWRKPGVAAVVSRVVDNARPGSIILLHDIHADSVAAVPEIIDRLRAKGFKLLTVSELLAAEQ